MLIETESSSTRTPSSLSSNLNLIALAFTALSAGVGLLQTYYNAFAESISFGNPEIVTKVTLWFPVGQFLISFGLGVVGFVGLRIVYPRFRSVTTNRWRIVLLGLGLLTFFFPITLPNGQNLATVRELMFTLSEHWDVYWVFTGTLVSLMALSRMRLKYGFIAFVLACVFAFSTYEILLHT